MYRLSLCAKSNTVDGKYTQATCGNIIKNCEQSSASLRNIDAKFQTLEVVEEEAPRRQREVVSWNPKAGHDESQVIYCCCVWKRRVVLGANVYRDFVYAATLLCIYQSSIAGPLDHRRQTEKAAFRTSSKI